MRYRYLSTFLLCTLSHERRAYVRPVKGSFKMKEPPREYICVVYEPLREPSWLLERHLGNVVVPSAVFKAFLWLFLQGLDLLHTGCHTIHTDLRADTFFVVFENYTVLESCVHLQLNSPSPYKVCAGCRTYQSRPDFDPLKKQWEVRKSATLNSLT